MPCDSSYLEPRQREKELQRAAKLLVYVFEQIEQDPPDWVLEESKNIYASDERSVTMLCEILTELTPDEREPIVYNAHNPTARDLANWWEEHQEADRLRIEREELEQARQSLVSSAKAKLSTAEITALGI